ncbi:hypothetical protein [Natronorubrum sp. A-ect3]|uniref:DUF7312 domain-containing protein n=1 Tax=Natronorubrum sp. A-ect3 TaxID=3242698 RepID=UPI00359E77F8
MADDPSGADGDDDSTHASSTGAPDAHSSDTAQDDVTDHWGDSEFDEQTDSNAKISVGGERSPSDRSDDSDEYRIPLDLSDESDDEPDDADDDPYGPEPSSTPVEPGDPELESILFVFLGAVAMLLVIFRVVSIPL